MNAKKGLANDQKKDLTFFKCIAQYPEFNETLFLHAREVMTTAVHLPEAMIVLGTWSEFFFKNLCLCLLQIY